jgi:hypothetical protein
VRVYAESNFVLEIALAQEEESDCQVLLADAAGHRSSLILPSISIFEPHYKIAGNGKRRRDLAQQVEAQAREFGRTRGSEESSKELRNLIRVFADSESAEQARLFDTFESILNSCELIPLTSDIVLRAVKDVIPRLGLALPDALVYASVLEHLRVSHAEKSCFVTKNANDFGDPDIGAELMALNCKILFKFTDAVRYSR